jgi:hypothetical protein
LDNLTGDKQLIARLDAISDTRQYLGTIGLRAVAEAKAIVPRRTGNLGRTIRLGAITPDYVEIVAGGERNVGYAKPVEFGSRPHEIVPVRAKALAWGGARTLAGGLRKGSSATHFARRVRHPGTKPHPYLVPGVQRALRAGGLKEAIVKAWNGAA